MNKSIKFFPAKIPSLKLSITIIFIYLFAILPLVAGIMYFMIKIGYSSNSMRTNLSEGIIIIQICVTTVLTYYLVKKYSDYLFSYKWKANYIQYLLIGMKWSMPIVVIHIIFLSIPSLRHNLTEEYFSMKILTVKGISNFSFIIFSIWLILGALFEELIFRGIILQKLQKFINNALCVIITAGLFGLCHFVFSPIKIGYLAGIFIVGLLSGFAFTSTGSCISAIVPHLLNNVICIGIVWTIR